MATDSVATTVSSHAPSNPLASGGFTGLIVTATKKA